MGTLDGLVVLDLTHVVAGPFCTMLLGDMGADVVKVERPGHGDHSRAWHPQWNGTACTFLALNRNKRSIALDLDKPGARAVIQALARRADVVVESLRTPSLAKLGITYDELRAVNPRLVYCSISGYGRTGPKADLGGYDLIAQAYGALMSVTGEPGGPPVRAGYSVIDIFTGMAAYGAIMTALLQREKTGAGQYVETSLLDSVVAQMSYHAVAYLATGKVPGPLGTQSPSLVPYQLFEAADAQLIVGCNNDVAWQRLCVAIERPDLARDARFATNADRLRNKAELIPLLADVFRSRTAAAWGSVLEAHGVPCSPIHTVADVLADEQVAARELVPAVPHPAIPGLRAPAPPFRVVGAARTASTPPPALGGHSDAILRELGFSAQDIAALHAEGVVA